MSNIASGEQAVPKGRGLPVFLDVIKDITERVKVGVERYGEPLKPHNGREALVDLYQELIDAVMYTRQRITEENEATDELVELRRLVESLELANAVLIDERDNAFKKTSEIWRDCVGVRKLSARERYVLMWVLDDYYADLAYDSFTHIWLDEPPAQVEIEKLFNTIKSVKDDAE